MTKCIVFLFLLGSMAHGQVPNGAIEFPEYNILYRGYPNKFIPAVSNSNGYEIFVKGSGVQIEKSNDGTYFIAKPIGRTRQAYISLKIIKELDTLDIKTIAYRVHNLPDPMLYWGSAKQEQTANVKAKKIFAKYPPEIPLNAVFQIVKCEIIVDSNSVICEGSNLECAETLLQSIEDDKEVVITVLFKGPDEILRKRTAHWTVNPWKETEEPGVNIIVD